jgi:TRAP-type C4-dicarboxylate transport system substrate-binding protein
LWDEHEAAARRIAEAAGVEVIGDVDYAGFTSALVPLHSTIASDPRSKSLIERIKATQTP